MRGNCRIESKVMSDDIWEKHLSLLKGLLSCCYWRRTRSADHLCYHRSDIKSVTRSFRLMAYVRINAADHRPLNDAELGSVNNYDVHPNSHKNDRKKPDGHKLQKPLIIFTLNISFLSPIFRYLVLAFGMFFFMCLYGYFQELVVYGWFNRKLSLFCTFLHFLGCSFFAQLQYNYSGRAPVTIESVGTSSTGGSTSPHITAKINSLSSNLLSSNGSASFGKWLQGKLAVGLSCIKCYLLKLQVSLVPL